MHNHEHALSRVLFSGGLAVFLVACGGGGSSSGGTSVQVLTYTGNVNPAVITTDNANSLVSDLMSSSDTTLLLSVQSTGRSTLQPVDSAGVLALGQRLQDRLMKVAGASASTSREASYRVASVTINEVEYCDTGTITLTGTLSDTGTGSVAVVIDQGSLEGEILDGTVVLDIFAFDLSLYEPLNARFTFDRFSLRDSVDDFVLSGTMQVVSNYSSNMETATLDLVFKDENTGDMLKTENLVVSVAYDSLQYPSTYQETISGRVYDSITGYVDITTLQALGYSSLTVFYPDLGGSLLFTGDNGATITATSQSASYVEISVDVDGDGFAEQTNTVLWTSLE